jgi:hypothetical protein
VGEESQKEKMGRIIVKVNGEWVQKKSSGQSHRQFTQ